MKIISLLREGRALGLEVGLLLLKRGLLDVQGVNLGLEVGLFLFQCCGLGV